MHAQRAASPPRSPTSVPSAANFASVAAGCVRTIAATSLTATASGSSTVFTCTAEDQLKNDVEKWHGAPVSSMIAVLVLMVLSAIVGRWSASRHQSKERVHDPEPWVVVSETTAMSQPPPDNKERPAACKEPGGVREAASQTLNTLLLNGDKRLPARVGPSGVREVASQAPCTYTIVRGCARGRFQPLPDTAHG